MGGQLTERRRRLALESGQALTVDLHLLAVAARIAGRGPPHALVQPGGGRVALGERGEVRGQQRLIGREKNTAGQFAFLPGHFLPIGAVVYHNVSFGYNIPSINTRIDVGIDNLSDKQPALLYQNNVLNGNVDPNTFDTIGRFYWARVTVKF